MAATLLVLVGCGSPTSVPMSGRVAIDGNPVDAGTLILTPLERSASPSTGCAIIEGRYNIAGESGPRPGVEYRVEITAVHRDAASSSDPMGDPVRQVFEDSIPDVFNRNSTLTLAIPKDATSVEHDFDLQSP